MCKRTRTVSKPVQREVTEYNCSSEEEVCTGDPECKNGFKTVCKEWVQTRDGGGTCDGHYVNPSESPDKCMYGNYCPEGAISEGATAVGGSCVPTSWSDWSECSLECGGGTQTRVDDCGAFESRSCNTQSCGTTVSGVLWNATDKSCSGGHAPKIKSSDLEGDVTPRITSVSPAIEGNFDGSGNYTIEEAPTDTQTLCVPLPAPKDKPNFKYALSCVNDDTSGIISGSCVSIDVPDSPSTYDLGYKLFSRGWFHIIAGDVFAGCSSCIDSISLGIPAAIDILGEFKQSLVESPGSVFANADLSIKNPSGNDKIVDPNNKYYAKRMNDVSFWPDTFSFNAPSGASDTSDCSNLDADSVYKVDSSCVNDAISNGSYQVSGDGVAVVFVDGDLEFENEFTTGSNDSRVVFVVDGGVTISSDVGTDVISSSTTPHIQAGIIARQGIVFESNGNDPSDDLSIVVEGPLVSKDGSIEFNRDRGLSNGYPAEVVVYNPIYLNSLKDSLIAEISVMWTLQ